MVTIVILYLKLLVMYFHSQIIMLLIEMIRSMFRGPLRQSGNSNLPSLNIGKAVVAGLMVPVPAMVKIGEFTGKLSGGDPDVESIWRGMRGKG